MQQVSLYVSGERDYPSIKGSTGPLVYPAAHVYIYNLLYHLTDEGRNILLGQILFAALYLATLIVAVACYRQIGAPPYLLPLLVLSKRLHSIYMLRMFNDGIAAFAMWIAIYLFMKRKWTAGVAVWSLGVGVKMTLVLFVPAIATITVLSLGLAQSAALGAVAILVQVRASLDRVSKSVGMLYATGLMIYCRSYWLFPSSRPMRLAMCPELSSCPGNSCSSGR